MEISIAHDFYSTNHVGKFYICAKLLKGRLHHRQHVYDTMSNLVRLILPTRVSECRHNHSESVDSR